MSYTAMAQPEPPLRALVVVPLALVLACGAAFSQQITGGIYGTVIDDQGLRVPGATVTVSSPQHIQAELRTTSEQGTYRALRLTPSSHYTVTVELAGFQTAIFREVILRAGQDIAVDARLSPAALQESITVSGESALVDVKSSQVMRTLEQERLENIPLGRGFDDLLTSMAGVLDAEYVFTPTQTVLGSDPRGNLYTIDGAVANDTTVGYILSEIPIDMIEEVQVTTSGQPAEFGMSHGGVFNFVTKSGGNNFSGTGYIYYQGEGTEWDNLTPELEEQLGVGSSVIKDQDIGGTFGGPIRRDSIWFFGNIRRLNEELQSPVLPTQPFERNQTHAFLKVTGQISGNTRAHGSLTARDQDRYPSNAFFGNADSPETWQNQNRNQQILNLNLTHLFGNDTILDVKYNRQWKEFFWDAPNNPDGTIGYRDWFTGKEFGGLTGSLRHEICRCSWGTGANLSHFRENASGSHEIKAGFFFDFPNGDREFFYPRNEDIRQYLADGQAFRVWLEWFPFNQALAIDRYSFFVQDQWTIGDRLTLNLGVRYVTSEGWIPEQARGGGRWFPRVVFPETRDLINFGNVAPRLGVVYALGEEKRTSLKAYYGRHYKALLNQDLSSASPVSGGSELYTWNDLNGDLKFQDGEQGTLLSRVLNPVFGDRSDLVVPDLKNSYVDAFHITADHELTSEMVLSVGGTFKRERSIMETFVRRLEGGDQQNPFNDYRPLDVVNQADGSPLTIFALRPEFLGSRFTTVLGNPDFAGKLFRDYNGVEFALRRRFRDGWQLMVAYNLSETRGDLANDFAGTTTANQVYDNPNTLINAEGVLALDATHQFKLQGTYTLPYDILVSGFYQAVTGFPIHLRESGNFDLAQGAPTARYFPLCPGTGVTKGHGGGGGCRPPPLGVPGIVVESNIAVAAFARGTERHAFRNKIDIRVEKQFRFGNGMRLGLIADIFNLGNINRVTSFQSLTIDQAAPFLAAADIELPRILRVGVRFSF